MKLSLTYPQVKGFILYRYKTLVRNPLGIKDSIAFAFKDAISIPFEAQKDTVVITKQVVTQVIKPTFEPSKPTNLSKYFYDKELIIMWETSDNLDSIAKFVVYEKYFDKKNKIDTLNIVATTENNFINLRVKRSIFGRKRYLCVSTKGKNQKESPKSDLINVKISKIIQN